MQRRISTRCGREGIAPDSKHRKCAKNRRRRMGGYHLTADQRDLRRARAHAQTVQPARPLIDGSGNFGSLDGRSAAASVNGMPTPAPSPPISRRARSEHGARSVRTMTAPNRSRFVLPAQFPHLLVKRHHGHRGGHGDQLPPHNRRGVRGGRSLVGRAGEGREQLSTASSAAP